MSILVPLNAAQPTLACKAYSTLHDRGADEFYLGFYDKAWDEAFGKSADINRMSGFGDEANALDFEKLCETIRAISDISRATANAVSTNTRVAESERPVEEDRAGDKIFIAFNTAQYTSPQIAFIEKRYFDRLKDAGATGIICSGPNLVAAARKHGLEAVASCMCAVLNADIARYYVELGATRIVLPRELSLDEITSLIHAVPDAEYEAFLMRNGCLFSDSHCLGRHRKGCYSLCSTLRQADHRIVDLLGDESCVQAAEKTHALYSERLFIRACGLCALWHLERAGVGSYKIVGRGDDPRHIFQEVQLVAQNIRAAKAAGSFEDYLRTMEVPSNREVLCEGHFSCYYPEVNDLKDQLGL